MRQRGQVLILVLLLLSVAAGAVLFSFFNSTKVTLDNDQKTADALALAKAALIGRAVSDGNRPGSLPCPDVDNDGVLTMNVDYFSNGNCASNIGRLPWRTLGLPDLRDADGERLWYAVSPNFRDITGNIINSDTRGIMTVYAADGLTLLADGSTNQNPKGAVAVIFAPGATLGGQTRDSANQNIAANYLDDSGIPDPNNLSITIKNSNTNGPFIVGRLRDPAHPNYNDRVLYITTPQFIPTVEMRVAGELRKILQSYYDVNFYFPFAAAYDDATGSCANNLTRGRVPVSSAGACSALAPWSLPAWFTNNKWWQVMYYSVAAGYVYSYPPPRSCTGGCLTVDSDTSIAVLFFTPGTPLNPTWRVPPGSFETNLTYYLDSPNDQGWLAAPTANISYVTPPHTVTTRLDRDRIFIFAGNNASTPQCAADAQALIALAPCGQPPHLNPQCVTRAANLGGCTCNVAANAIITPPCENNLNAPQCQSAVATLTACNS